MIKIYCTKPIEARKLRAALINDDNFTEDPIEILLPFEESAGLPWQERSWRLIYEI